MYKSFLENLDLELNNVDQVYTENLNKWKSDNTNLNDEDFITQELAYLENINTNILSKADVTKKEIYSTHLSKIKSKFPWDMEKLYKRYLGDKKFSMTGLYLIKKMEFEDLIKELNTYKAHYYYIFEKLSSNDRIQLNGDFTEHLEFLRDEKKNIPKKFKMYLNTTINEINDHFEESKSKDKLLKNENNLEKNPFPKLFTTHTVYECFLEYTSKYILDYHVDYSYLIGRLKSEKLIHNFTHNEYMRILFEDMELISKREYDDYLLNKWKLSTLSKSHHIQRQNNFNNVFDKLIN